MKKIYYMVTALLIIALIVAGIKIRQKRAAEMAQVAKIESSPWALQVSTVQKKDLNRTFPSLAELNASQSITLSAQIAGTLLDMGPREGVSVKKGQVLARIDIRELLENKAGLEAQLKAAEAEVIRSRDDYYRQQNLKKKGLTSDELLQARHTAWIAAKEKVNSLKRQIAALQVRIGYGQVRSPVDGVIAARLAEPGDAVQPGRALYRLNVDSSARLKVTLPQEILLQIRPKNPVILNYGGQKQIVLIDRIFPVLDAHALGFAEADLEQLPFGLPSGAKISASVVLQSVQNALTVPLKALLHTGKDQFWIFKFEQGRLHKIPVQLLLAGEKRAAIQGDIKTHDQVVIAHRSVLLRLKDQDPAVVELNDEI